MKIMIVRHAEPDYSVDGLTEKGRIEAELLSQRLAQVPDVLDCYVSPLGRARMTAEYTLARIGRQAQTLPWLCEFRGKCFNPDDGRVEICWDFSPRLYHAHPELNDAESWLRYPYFKDSNVDAIWEETKDGVDRLLESYGYRWNGTVWTAESNRRGTLILFCHLGIGMAVMAHLLHLAPHVLWQNFFVAPSSVTTLATEERIEHEVVWRCTQFGDISHLTGAGEVSSTAGLFPECFSGRDTTNPPEWEDRFTP